MITPITEKMHIGNPDATVIGALRHRFGGKSLKIFHRFKRFEGLTVVTECHGSAFMGRCDSSSPLSQRKLMSNEFRVLYFYSVLGVWISILVRLRDDLCGHDALNGPSKRVACSNSG
jgi:hypothetical protein